MVYLELAVVGGSAFVIGIGGGALLVKYTNIINMIYKKERYKHEVLNDPELLLEKLKENGDIVDMGEKMDLFIVEKEGKKQIEFKMTAIEEEEDPKITPKKRSTKNKK